MEFAFKLRNLTEFASSLLTSFRLAPTSRAIEDGVFEYTPAHATAEP